MRLSKPIKWIVHYRVIIIAGVWKRLASDAALFPEKSFTVLFSPVIFVAFWIVHDILPHYCDVLVPIGARLLVEQSQCVGNFMSYPAPRTPRRYLDDVNVVFFSATIWALLMYADPVTPASTALILRFPVILKLHIVATLPVFVVPYLPEANSSPFFPFDGRITNISAGSVRK